jgi:hypothetical protein
MKSPALKLSILEALPWAERLWLTARAMRLLQKHFYLKHWKSTG